MFNTSRRFGIVAVAVLVTCAAASSPGRVILPVIYAQDDAAALAMKSAPVILLVRVTALKLTGDKRMVGMPQEVGPMMPAIPLHLARVRADVLLTLRGPVWGNVEFYSWVWASGKHGGPRLFHPSQGSIHVVFLRTENRYLHTIGDYPSYDLELSPRWLPALLSEWKSSRNGDADVLERLVRLRLDAEFGGLSANEVRPEVISRDYYLGGLPDLVRLVGPFVVASQLDDICRLSGNQFGRLAACDVTAREFPGRCQAYRIAANSTPEGMEAVLTKAFKRCEAETQELILRLRSHDLPLRGFYGWSLTPEHRRGAVRLYASAMDPEFQGAACEIAATMPEARGIPECAGPRPQ